MTINAHIVDPSSGLQANVVDGTEKNALVVATRELKTYVNKPLFFSNETYGRDLNQNIAFSGTAEEIHNGTDDVLWTASAISGTWTFDSTTVAHAGSKSISGIATVNANTMQIAKGSNLDLSGYSAITLWIYLTSYDTRNDRSLLFYGWDVGVGQVGTSINLYDYINTGTIGAWQKASINLSDMNLTGQTIDAVRFQVASLPPGGPPNFYLDDIQIEEVGSPASFLITPAHDTWLHVESLMIQYADAYAGTLADNSMPSIPYNKWFGVSALSTGLLYQRVVDGVVENSTAIKQHSDLMNFSNALVSGYGSDGTNSWCSVLIKLTVPLTLKAETEDQLRIILSENLSGLLLFNVSAACKEENRCCVK